jgi:hypothetical protein
MTAVRDGSGGDAGVAMLLTRPKSPIQMHMLGLVPVAVSEVSVDEEESVVCVRQGAQRPRSMLPCLDEDALSEALRSSSMRRKMLAGLRSR